MKTQAIITPNQSPMTKMILNEQKTNHMKDEFESFVRLYILRLLVRYSEVEDILDRRSLARRVLSFLDINDIDFSEPTDKMTNSLMTRFNSLLLQNEDKNMPKTRLDHNLDLLKDSLKLSYAQVEVMRLSIVIDRNPLLANVLNEIRKYDRNDAVIQICIMLNLPFHEVQDAMDRKSILNKSGLIKFRRSCDVEDILEPVDENFSERMLEPQKSIEPLVSDAIIQAKDSGLELSDYSHIQKEVAIIKAHLQNALSESTKGVNILFYGPPGTGKSELSRLLPQILGARCFEVNFIDDDGDVLEPHERIRAYNNAQYILNAQKTILVFDEVEDILTNGDKGYQEGKAWFNHALESNNIPTIWITNNIYRIDNALIRRFNCVLEMDFPSKKRQKEILNKALAPLNLESSAQEKFIKKYAKQKYLSPAIITRAIKVANSCEQAEISAESKMTQDSAQNLKTISLLIDNTLKAQDNYIKLKKKKQDDYILPQHYSLEFVNCNEDLEKLAQGIARVKSARICLYGAPGTGKSAYGRYIAKLLGAPCILKRASDLKSMWLGESEKNIANAFKEARKKKAVLIFDEVDSFLHDRAEASKSWEVSEVNEMLTRMESFQGVFIATTNLMENLDSASLRRFDCKCEFKYLSPTQSAKLFANECMRLGIESSASDIDSRLLAQVESLGNIAPGDFTAIARAHKFREFKNASELFSALKNEVELKKDTLNTKRIGF